MSSRARRIALAAAVFVLIAAGRGIRGSSGAGDQRPRVATQLDNDARVLASAVDQRVDSYAQGLEGTRALVVAEGDALTNETFAKYVAAQDLQDDLPGIRGMDGFRW